MASFVKALSSHDFGASIKLLDEVIASTSKTSQDDDPNTKSSTIPLLFNRGYCFTHLKLWRKALKDYDEILRLDPLNIEASHRKGYVLVALDKTEEAVSLWTSALSNSQPHTDARLILDLHASIQDPSRVPWREVSEGEGERPESIKYAPRSRSSSLLKTLLDPRLVWPLFFILLLTSSSLITRHSFQVASKLYSAQSITKTRVPPTSPPPPPPPSSSKPSSSSPESSETQQCSTSDGTCPSSSKPSSSSSSPPPPPFSGNPSVGVQMAVNKINSGRVDEAEKILDSVLFSFPNELGARVARGTARALKRDLQGSVDDFTAAIEIEPRYFDTYKRRGQARSALGQQTEALSDLKKAFDLIGTMGQGDVLTKADCLLERGMIYQRQKDYRRACVEVKEAVKLDPNNFMAWNVLGLCVMSQGDIRDGIAGYEKALSLKPDLRDAWLNMAQAYKEAGDAEESEKAFAKLLALDDPDNPNLNAIRVISQMRQQKGDHFGAIRILDQALSHQKEELAIELLYQRGVCYHALGYMSEAVRDYEECMRVNKPDASEETRSFQYLSFYQKEMALYLYSNFDKKTHEYCLDCDIQPLFKELWAKKGPPTAELISQYSPQPLLPMSPPVPPPRVDKESLSRLSLYADRLGDLLQNNHQGFMYNTRLQRAAGFAAIELAQTMRGVIADRKAGNQTLVMSEGSSVHGGASGRHLFGWRDAMDIVVKWRQLAEPNDQVIWVDLLTRREFEQGFGSHTPMFTGQTKTVRYHMNFARAQELQKEVLLKEGHAFDAHNNPVPCGSPDQVEAIKAASTAEQMYQVIRNDSWVVVSIHSASRPSHLLEGTRLTLVRVPNQPDAYEFSIRTPVTPPRWKDFDLELESAWESILDAWVDDDLPLAAKNILTYSYYWYNFMPLARGTAACGYATLLSLFWSAGMPVTASIPKRYQVDWEAILNTHPDVFITSVGKWLYPDQARGGAESSSSSSASELFPDVMTLPLVSELLSTPRYRIEALNGLDAKRV